MRSLARTLGASVLVVALSSLSACTSRMPMGYGPACTNPDPDMCPGSNTAGGGGGGSGGGGGTSDAGRGDGGRTDGGRTDGGVRRTVDATGQVVVLLTLPPATDITGTLTEANWSVESIFGTGATAALTNADGNFTLPGAVVVDDELTLRARPPAGRGIYGALATYVTSATGAVRAPVYAVQGDAFERAAASASITPNPSNAHAVLQFQGLPAAVNGISVEVLGSSTAQVAYDDGGTNFTVSAGRTNAKGLVLITNADVPETGGFLDLRLTKGAVVVPMRIRVAAGTIAWVAAMPL